MIPWGVIVEGIFRLINLFITNKEQRDKMKKQMFEFIKTHDESVLSNIRLKAEYDELVARSKMNTDEGKKDEKSV